MAVDIFTKQDFEEALPVHKDTGEPLCTSLGLVQNEYCYTLHPFKQKDFKIFIRSSIGHSGISAQTGDDSIRCYIVLEHDGNFIPWGNKSQNYVTRVKGWQRRMVDTLRLLAGQIQKIPDACPTCKKTLTVKPFIVKKEGPNKGRRFLKCSECSYFQWIQD